MTTTYDLRVTIVDHVDNEGEPCGSCQLEGSVIQAQAYVSLGGHGGDLLETCLACLIPTIDSTPYVDTDATITVEVARSATARPF